MSAQVMPYPRPKPAPLDPDGEFIALLCYDVAHRNLEERMRRVDRAQGVLLKAVEAAVQAREEALAAVRILADAAYEVAEAKS